MAVLPFRGPVGGSPGCCEGARYCNGARQASIGTLASARLWKISPFQQFIAQRAVEALVVAVLPRRAWRDIERLHADLAEPFTALASDEFAAVIGPNMSGRPTPEEQLCRCRQHILMAELACDDESQALAAEFVNDGEDEGARHRVAATWFGVSAASVSRWRALDLRQGNMALGPLGRWAATADSAGSKHNTGWFVVFWPRHRA